MDVNNSKSFKLVIFILSVLLSGFVLKLAGLDASQANIVKLSNFSLPIFVVFGICVSWTYNSIHFLTERFYQKRT
jgi:hypothetical protein